MKRLISILLSCLLFVCLMTAISASATETTAQSVAGASLWLRADQGVTTDGSNVITQWADQSGNDRNGIAYQTYGMPKLVENSINGQPAVLFEGGTQVVDIPVPLDENWGQEFSIFFVYQPTSVPQGGKHFIGTDDWRMFNLHTYDTGGGLYVGNTETQKGSDTQNRINSSENPGTYVSGETVLIQFTHQNGVATLWKNGVKIVEKAMPSPMKWSQFRLGLPGSNAGLDGALSELIVFDEELSTSKQIAVSRYLYEKYFNSVQSTALTMQTALRLSSGESTNLTVTGAGEGSTLIWSSSNSSVASVDAYGNVTGISAGTATISVVVQGQFQCAECVVTVTQQDTGKGMVLWLDAATVEKDANGVLTKWPDQSGMGHDGISYAGTSMPKYVENAINGKPAVRFETENGVKDAVNIPSLTGDMENFSVFFVYNPKSFNSPYNHVVRAKGEWKEFIMHTYAQLSGDGSIYIGSNLTNRFDKNNEGAGYWTAGKWSILEYRAQGSVISLYRDGVLLGTKETGSTCDPWTGFDIGVVDQMYGDMAELRIYNCALTDEERSDISQELQMKYYNKVAPESMAVTSSNGTTLDRNTPTTQLSVTVKPAAAGTDVNWSVMNISGGDKNLATVSEDGLLTAYGTGTILVTATHKASGMTASLKIYTRVEKSYAVIGETTITTPGGTTVLSVLMDNDPMTGLIWKLYGEDMQPTDLADIDQNGKITAKKNGTVIAVAEKDGQTWATNVLITGQAFDGVPVDAVYVSADGDDSNDGTYGSPKKTIAAGLATGADYVYVMPGHYDLTQPLKPQSGTSLVGYPMGTALITGGCQVPESTVWTQVEGHPYYVAEVTVANPFRELYVNGTTASLAESKAYTASEYYEDGVQKGYIIDGLSLPEATDSNMEMHWNHKYWRCNRLVVDEIRATDNGVIILPEYESFRWATVCDFASAGPVASQPFTLLNDLAFLDEPGEWFYDEDAGKLYYYPEEGESIRNLEFYIPQIDTLVEISGTNVNDKIENITIDNLHFAYTAWQRAVEYGCACVQADFVSNDIGNGSHTDAGELPAAVIHSEFAKNISIKNCDIRNTGANAIILENAVSDSVIENNVIEDTAFSAITISRPQNSFLDQENEEVPKNILIFNNRINNAAWKYHSGSGICGYYTDSLTVDHNHVSHTSWAAMTFGWNGWQATEKDSITHRNLTVTHNYVYSFAEVSRDSGGIYTLGQCPNGLIAYNHLEKLVRDYAGIYNDEGSAYYFVFKNVIDDVNGNVVNWWNRSIHDMYAEGNYHDLGSVNNNATRGFIEGTTQYSRGTRPSEAQAIVDEAGLTNNSYQPIRSFSKDNVAEGKNVTFVQRDGKMDYGTVGHMPQFTANGLENTYAEAATGGSALIVDLLDYYDVTGASLVAPAEKTIAAYKVETSVDSIDWVEWDAASACKHVRFIKFTPEETAVLCVQDVIVTGTVETGYVSVEKKNLQMPNSDNLTVQLQAESATMTADHLTSWKNDAGGNDARIPDAHSTGLDEHAVANSGYSKKPIVIEGVVNDRPIVRFDGFDDAMQVDNVSGSSEDMTLMLYVRPTDADHFKFSSDGFVLEISNGTYQVTFGSTTLSAETKVSMNTWQLLMLTVDHGTAKLSVDGVTVLEGTVSGSAHNTLRLGDNVGIRRKDCGTALGVDLAELALYTEALGAENIATVQSLIAGKYSPQVRVEQVSLDKSEVTLNVGSTAVLTAEVTPDTANDKTVSWTSSDAAVATVDKTGLVTAVSVGAATITVTTEDGGKTATCTVTVTANKAALQELYGQYVGTEKGNYTDETWTAFQKALEAAKKVLADEEATQEEVDAALAALSDAKDGLTEKTVIIDPNPTPKPDTKPDTKPSNTMPFRDVRESDWYSDAVEYVYENGLMNGTGKNTFSPNSQTTRGMIVTILYRQSGSPKVSSDNKTWWSDARVWAMECGISDGTNMDGNITREQLAAMLYRYAKLTGADVSARGNLNKFTDSAQVSDWAAEAVQWAVGEGILGGRPDGTLDPKGLATRAEVAAMFMRFCRNVIKK